MPPNVRPLRLGKLPRPIAFPLRQRRFLATDSKPPIDNIDKGPSTEQAVPLGPYYESILIKPTPVPDPKPEEPPVPSQKSPKKRSPAKRPKDESTASPTRATSAAAPEPIAPKPTANPAPAQEKARVVFGSRLAGPAERAERLASLRKQGSLVAGVLTPPRPEEPDYCCMSGCVNCVWDRYRDEMDDWASATAQAERRLQAQRGQGPVDVLGGVGAVKGMGFADTANAGYLSVDDDGGGSETNWQLEEMQKTERPKIVKDFWDDDLYKHVPVGIREFMKQEKRLKARHEREGTLGG